ncbi:MAG TPA: hypothetical protein VNF00_05910 [Candidatus Acidoferrales bacterium]|nr:hypothetical protein [Candidatus Acidoferrales bacterium]
MTCLVAGALALFSSGCLRHKVHAAAPVTLPLEPPSPVVTSEPAKSPAPVPAPTTQGPKNPEPSTPPPGLTPKPDTLRRPVTAAPEPERPAAPQISPQISSSDQAQLTKQTQQYIGDAQQNLRRAGGRQLNPSQRDMVDKIRGFLGQAQDAIRTSDWSRAKNLAQKADLLSLELVKTL